MAAPPTQSLVLTFEDARRVVEDHASRLIPVTNDDDTVSLLHAAGRVLAEPVADDCRGAGNWSASGSGVGRLTRVKGK